MQNRFIQQKQSLISQMESQQVELENLRNNYASIIRKDQEKIIIDEKQNILNEIYTFLRSDENKR